MRSNSYQINIDSWRGKTKIITGKGYESVCFGDMETGSLFYSGGDLFVKTENITDLYLDVRDIACNAVDLNCGHSHIFDDLDPVLLVSGKKIKPPKVFK